MDEEASTPSTNKSDFSGTSKSRLYLATTTKQHPGLASVHHVLASAVRLVMLSLISVLLSTLFV